MENGVLRWPTVHNLVKISRPTAWRLERSGKFPRRIQLGQNSVAWVESEIMEWISKRPRVGGQQAEASGR